MIPLTKFLSPDDYDDDSSQAVRLYITKAAEKLKLQGLLPDLPHEHRIWEYNTGLLASIQVPHLRRALEVGGSNSLFLPSLIELNLAIRRGSILYDSLEAPEWAVASNLVYQERQAKAIDPEVRLSQMTNVPEAKGQYDFIACISTIEHIEDPLFLDRIAPLLAPRGVLFLTSDAAEKEPDTYHFHWMRTRIYTPERWRALETYLSMKHHLAPIGGRDLTWKGPHVYDYNFVSMALGRLD